MFNTWAFFLSHVLSLRLPDYLLNQVLVDRMVTYSCFLYIIYEPYSNVTYHLQESIYVNFVFCLAHSVQEYSLHTLSNKTYDFDLFITITGVQLPIFY